MGATEGVELSEEERSKECEGGKELSEMPTKISKLFSSLDQEAIDNGLYEDALQDILTPPSAPDMNNQIIHGGSTYTCSVTCRSHSLMAASHGRMGI